MLRFSLCFLGLILVSLSKQDVTDDVPYLLTLNHKSVFNGDVPTVICGAIMITPEWVLTPAYCVDDVRKDLMLISTNGSFYIPMEKIVVHDKYVLKNRTFDVSLVKLTEKITDKCSHCKPIENFSSDSPKTGDILKIVGWGYANTSFSDYVVLTVDETAISTQECNQIYMENDFYPIADTIFCIKNYFTDTSPVEWMLIGGSVVKDGVLVGIVTDDTGYYNPNLPGRYTDISLVKDWIHQVINTE